MFPIQYQIRRSQRRKTISLQVKNGELRVLAPEYVAHSYIVDLVRQKDKWIRAKIAQQNLHLAQQPKTSLMYQSALLYKGEPHTLLLCDNLERPETIILDSDKQTLSVKPATLPVGEGTNNKLDESAKTVVAKWYLLQAKEFLPSRLAYWGAKMGLEYSGLKIRHYKSRWGSCNSKQFITLNAKLMMAPEWVSDYVLIHELGHLVHLNHSPQFWQLVASYCPQYRQARDWFKQEHCNLSVFD